MFKKKDTFFPSLKVGQIIRDDRHVYKILAIKRQNSNEIVYDAYGEITYDFPPRRTRIEVVEYVSEEYENRKYESIHYPHNYGFIRDDLHDSIKFDIGTSSFIVDGKRFYCQLCYDDRKLKIGDSLYLCKKQYVVNDVCGHGSYGEILKLRCVSYSYRNKLKQWFTRSKKMIVLLSSNSKCRTQLNFSQQ